MSQSPHLLHQVSSAINPSGRRRSSSSRGASDSPERSTYCKCSESLCVVKAQVYRFHVNDDTLDHFFFIVCRQHLKEVISLFYFTFIYWLLKDFFTANFFLCLPNGCICVALQQVKHVHNKGHCKNHAVNMSLNKKEKKLLQVQ